MTAENRTLIELSDIFAIEYECRHCHARHSVTLKRIDRQVETCPNCNEKWIGSEHVPHKSTELAAVKEFLERLIDIQERRLGAIVRLEVKGLSEKAG